MSVANERNCPKCSKPKTPKRHGSITQWISVCNCNLLEDVPIDQAPVYLCKNCGKRITEGRSGSFTQWIFRSDSCDCKTPVPIEASSSEEANGYHSGERAATYAFQQVVESESEAAERSLKEDQEALECGRKLDLDATTFPLDRYTPMRAIGFGASGNVYLCRDRLLNTLVAVKRLHTVSAEELIAFQQEAKALSKLSHSSIVKVLNFGASESGAPYMVMEYIEGVSLESFVQSKGALTLDLALDVFDRLSSALGYAHSKGIFHRDLKSSNIILTDTDSDQFNVRIIDFGVAMVKHARGEPTLVQGRTVVGTPQYMPPDQAVGKPFTEQSEIYALGCTMFEALTGDVPFTGESALEIISKHANDQAPSLSGVNPAGEYPELLESIIARCLEKDPDQRYQSMEELTAALDTVAVDETVEASLLDEVEEEVEPETPLSQETASKFSRRALAIAASIVALVVVASVAYASRWLTSKNQVINKDDSEYINPLKPMSNQRESRAHIKAAMQMIGKGDTEFRLGESLTGESWHDEDLAIFDQCTKVTVFDFSGSPITENGLRHLAGNQIDRLLLNRTAVSTLNYLPCPTSITLMELTGTAISDSSLKKLLACKNLETLDLSETNVTAEGVRQLKPLPFMRLELKDCPRISNDDIRSLEEEFPNCDINFNTSLSGRILTQSNALARAHKLEEAIAKIKEGIVVARKGSDTRGAMEVHMLSTLVGFYTSMNNLKEAEKLGKQAIELGRAKGCTKQLANALHKLALAEERLKNLNEALTYTEECLYRCKQAKIRDYHVIEVMNLRSKLLDKTGRSGEARAQEAQMKQLLKSIDKKVKSRSEVFMTD